MTLTSFVCPSISAQRISSVTSPTAALDIPNLPLHPTLTTVSCPLTHCSESSHTFQWAADLQQCLSVGHCVLTRCSSTALLKRCREHSHTAMGLPMFVCSLLVVPCLHTADPWQYQMALFCLGFVCLFLSSGLVGLLICTVGVQRFFCGGWTFRILQTFHISVFPLEILIC